MANQLDDFEGPELPPSSGSEIQATVDLATMGVDGIFRPILVNQDENDILALTIEDAERLHRFLGEAVDFCKHAKAQLTQ